MRTYLCTVGTSCFNRVPGIGTELVGEMGIDVVADQLFEALEPMTTATLCAELAPLPSLGMSNEGRVVLYLSETDVGRCVGEVLRRLIEDRYPGASVLHRVVSGLQVKDARRFQTEGVPNFLMLMARDIESYGSPQCVLNPLGGYKALVPYSVLLGMMKQVRTAYLFEGSPQLIELPALPIDLAQSLISSYAPLCEAMERHSCLEHHQVVEILGRQSWGTAEVLLEKEGSLYTLSALGHLLWQSLGRRRALTPFVSHRAIAQLEALRRRSDCEPYRFLERVSRSQEFYKSKRHGNSGGDLVWLKPGDTADRYLVSIEEGWRMLVWMAVAHDEYDKLPSDIGSQLRGKKSEYSPFLRLDRYEL